MTWLTQLTGDTRDVRVRRDLADVQQMHRSVMALFPDVEPTTAREEMGVLYRSEPTAIESRIIVQSSAKPEASSQGYRVVGTRQLDDLIDALQAGSVVRYRLLANATQSTAVLGRRGKVRALTGDAALQWWEQRSAQVGLVLPSEPTWSSQKLSGKRGGGVIQIGATRFDGFAEVEDADLLRAAVRKGIGRGKAYGCGLLSVAAVR